MSDDYEKEDHVTPEPEAAAMPASKSLKKAKKPRTKWRQQLILSPHFADMRLWPMPDLSGLNEEDTTLFFRRRKAVAAVIGGGSVTEEAKCLKVSVREIYRLLDRCLGSPVGEAPALSLGLVPDARIVEYAGGRFKALMEQFPDVFEQMRTSIKKELRGDADAPHLGEHAFWSKFVALMMQAGAKADAYPFNTDGVARESLRQWRRQTELEIKAGKERTNVILMSEQASLIDVCDTFEYDEHFQDFQLGILFETANKNVHVRVARFWVLAIADRVSTAAFAYSWGFGKKINQDDYLGCLADATTIWKPYPDLPTGLHYPADGGMPSMMEAYQYAVPTFFAMDNDWAHYGLDAQHVLLRRWQSIPNWGRAKFPIARKIVEMLFARLARYEHQIPSTTGNSPFDPRRDQRYDRVPIVPIWHLPYLMDIAFAEIAAQPRPDLFGQSPLSILRRRADSGLPLRKLDERFRAPGNAFRVRRELFVTGDPVQGRRLHCNFVYCAYVGSVLNEVVRQGTRRVQVEFDRRDIRKLDVLDAGGRVLGQITVQGPWAQFPHSERLRSAVYAETKGEAWMRPEVLQNYFDGIATKADRPSVALRLFNIFLGTRSPDEPWPGHSGPAPASEVPKPEERRAAPPVTPEPLPPPGTEQGPDKSSPADVDAEKGGEACSDALAQPHPQEPDSMSPEADAAPTASPDAPPKTTTPRPPNKHPKLPKRPVLPPPQIVPPTANRATPRFRPRYP